MVITLGQGYGHMETNLSMYERIRPQMKTGDVIAFSGNGLVSEIIKRKTRSEISHVGMVYSTRMEGFGDSVMLIESTTLTSSPDAKTGKIFKGVQLQLLSQRLSCYDGSVMWLPLKDKLLPHHEDEMLHWLRTRHASETSYDAFQAILSAIDLFDWFPGVENDACFSELFCSELVSKALQIADIIPDWINPSEQTPADVVKYDIYKKAVLLKTPT